MVIGTLQWYLSSKRHKGTEGTGEEDFPRRNTEKELEIPPKLYYK
jgi:hypothetical protein